MSGIRSEIENSFRQGDALSRLILVNLGVFLLFYILKAVGALFQFPLQVYMVDWMALPSSLATLVTRPWTLVTYMFLHEGFLHIFFNLLVLFFSGRLFMEYFNGRRLLSTFLLGGVIGGAIYVIFYNVFPAFSDVLSISNNRGASAGVMAILIAIAAYVPRFPVKLFFVLNVELWVVAALVLLMDLISIGDGNNMGGHIAHLGGALFGYLSIRQLKRNRDITEGFSRVLDSIADWFKPRPERKVRKVYSGVKSGSNKVKSQQPAQDQARMDQILDKISRSGYESLSKEEKDYLFKIGQQ